MPKLTLRIGFDTDRAIGPGKVKLLEMIDKYGSISEAGRQMGMSYRRAWLLVDSLNRSFRVPVIASQKGGQHGGGAAMTEFGHAVVQHYRAVESAAEKAHIKALSAALAKRTKPRAQTHRRENSPAVAKPKLTALIHIMAPSWHLRPASPSIAVRRRLVWGFSCQAVVFGFCSQFFVRSGKGRSSFFNRAAGVKKVLFASGLRRIVVSPLVGRHWRNAVSLFG
jgi:molybdate transport system regulatory protein